MAVEWFCQVMGSEVGPLNQDQLIDMVRHHQVNPEDLIRRGESSWVPAFEVKGLFEAAAKPAPTNSPEPAADDSAPAQDDNSRELSGTTTPATVEKETATNAPGSNRNSGATHRVDPAPRNGLEHSADGVNDWFCIASGEKQGPLGFDDLKKLASDGRLRGRDRVWRGSWPKFQKAAEVDGLGVQD